MSLIHRILEYYNYLDAKRKALDFDATFAYVRFIADWFELDENNRIYLAFLYGVFYNTASSLVTLLHLPSGSDETTVYRFWEKWKHRLVFISDMKRIQYRNTFPLILKRTPKDWKSFLLSISNDTPRTNWKNLLECDYFYDYRYFRWYLMLPLLKPLEVSYETEPWYSHPERFQSIWRGLLYIYEGRLITAKEAERTLDPVAARQMFQTIVDVGRRLNKYDGDFRLMESLCSYHKYIVGRRPIGHYYRRHYNAFLQLRDLLPKDFVQQFVRYNESLFQS